MRKETAEQRALLPGIGLGPAMSGGVTTRLPKGHLRLLQHRLIDRHAQHPTPSLPDRVLIRTRSQMGFRRDGVDDTGENARGAWKAPKPSPEPLHPKPRPIFAEPQDRGRRK